MKEKITVEMEYVDQESSILLKVEKFYKFENICILWLVPKGTNIYP